MGRSDGNTRSNSNQRSRNCNGSDPFGMSGFGNFGMGGMIHSMSPFGMQASFDLGGFGGGSSMTSFSSSFGGGFSGSGGSISSSSTTISNGKKVTTKKVVQNGKETVHVYENDVLKSHKVNGEEQLGRIEMDNGKKGKNLKPYKR